MISNVPGCVIRCKEAIWPIALLQSVGDRASCPGPIRSLLAWPHTVPAVECLESVENSNIDVSAVLDVIWLSGPGDIVSEGLDGGSTGCCDGNCNSVCGYVHGWIRICRTNAVGVCLRNVIKTSVHRLDSRTRQTFIFPLDSANGGVSCHIINESEGEHDWDDKKEYEENINSSFSGLPFNCCVVGRINVLAGKNSVCVFSNSLPTGGVTDWSLTHIAQS